ncbi:MAG: hypothetical protein NVS2B9_21820 [Myxococcales bacterium]
MAKKAASSKKGAPRTGARPRSAARPAKPAAKRKAAPAGRWSQRVTDTSDALDLKPGVFEKKSPRAVAASLKRSAEQSHRRKGSPYQSAMSMLTFFVNRAGKQLGGARRRVLESAKRELRALFHRPAET